MTVSQNLSLRASAQKMPRLFGRLAGCVEFLLSIPTLCPHRNRHNLSSFQQACWDCGRVRYNGGTRWSVWHKDGVR